MARLEPYLPKLLKHEGGFVNHPKDPGGATNKGITLNTYEAFYGKNKTIADLKNITDSEVLEIYKKGYWDKILGDKITDQSLAEIIFDHAVNTGTSRAVNMLQFILNDKFDKTLKADGAMGQKTIDAINSVDADLLYKHYYNGREAYYRHISTVNRNLAGFLNGWLNRLKTFKK